MIDPTRLQARLDELGMTANSASEAAGLGRTYLRDMLRGRIKNPSALRLMSLAEVLKTTPGYLLGTSEDNWPEALPSADDRSEEGLEHSLDGLRAHIEAVKEGGSNPANKVIFDLLDAVPAANMVEISTRFISENIWTTLLERELLTGPEATVLMGPLESEEENDLFRRLIVARLVGLIDRSTMSQAILLLNIHLSYRNARATCDLDGEELREFVEPLLKASGLSMRTTETARLAIMSIFARFLDLRPQVPARLLSVRRKPKP